MPGPVAFSGNELPSSHVVSASPRGSRLERSARSRRDPVFRSRIVGRFSRVFPPEARGLVGSTRAFRPTPASRDDIPDVTPGRTPPTPLGAPPSSARQRGVGPLSSRRAARNPRALVRDDRCARLGAHPVPARPRARDRSGRRRCGQRPRVRAHRPGARGVERRGVCARGGLRAAVGRGFVVRASARDVRRARRGDRRGVPRAQLPNGCRLHESFGLLRLRHSRGQGHRRSDRRAAKEVVGASLPASRTATSLRHVPTAARSHVRVRRLHAWPRALSVRSPRRWGDRSRRSSPHRGRSKIRSSRPSSR